MKQNFKKKGFTLVELLVVIAILATLASVSVIGYLHFTKKAEISNDTALATQLNTILAANEVEEGKNKTMHDAVLDINENGITSDKLRTANPNETDLLWDQDSDRFIVASKNNEILYKNSSTTIELDGNKIKETYTFKLWKAANKAFDKDIQDNRYSVYLRHDIEDTFLANYLPLNVTKGIDVGVHKNIVLNYNGKNDIGTIIRGNENTNLTINNPLADLNIYGKFNNVDILNSSANSVHSFANINAVTLLYGHLVLESNSIINKFILRSDNFDNSNLTINEKGKLLSAFVTNSSTLSQLQAKIGDDLKVEQTIDPLGERKLVFKKFNTISIQSGKEYRDSYQAFLRTNSQVNLEYKFEISDSYTNAAYDNRSIYIKTNRIKLNIDNNSQDVVEIKSPKLEFFNLNGQPDGNNTYINGYSGAFKTSYFRPNANPENFALTPVNGNMGIIPAKSRLNYDRNLKPTFKLFATINGKDVEVPLNYK